MVEDNLTRQWIARVSGSDPWDKCEDREVIRGGARDVAEASLLRDAGVVLSDVFSDKEVGAIIDTVLPKCLERRILKPGAILVSVALVVKYVALKKQKGSR